MVSCEDRMKTERVNSCWYRGSYILKFSATRQRIAADVTAAPAEAGSANHVLCESQFACKGALL